MTSVAKASSAKAIASVMMPGWALQIEAKQYCLLRVESPPPTKTREMGSTLGDFAAAQEARPT
jgi:hypothetical protein